MFRKDFQNHHRYHSCSLSEYWLPSDVMMSMDILVAFGNLKCLRTTWLLSNESTCVWHCLWKFKMSSHYFMQREMIDDRLLEAVFCPCGGSMFPTFSPSSSTSSASPTLLSTFLPLLKMCIALACSWCLEFTSVRLGNVPNAPLLKEDAICPTCTFVHCILEILIGLHLLPMNVLNMSCNSPIWSPLCSCICWGAFWNCLCWVCNPEGSPWDCCIIGLLFHLKLGWFLHPGLYVFD